MSEKKEKTRKGARVAVVLISAVAVLLAVAVLILAYRMPPEEAEAYIDGLKAFAVERVVPVAVSVLAAVAVILSMLTPVAARVKSAAGDFTAATRSVQGTESRSDAAVRVMQEKTDEQAKALAAHEERMQKAMDVAIADMQKQVDAAIAGMREQVDAACKKIRGTGETVDAIHAEVDASMNVLLTAFENLPELVRSGHAATIERMAGQYRKEGGDGHEGTVTHDTHGGT